MTSSALATATLVRLGQATNRTFVLPLLIFYPTGRCNSRCVSCDWWKQSGADDLTLDEIARVADALPALGTRMVVFSGGEPLLRPEVFDAAQLFRARGMTLHLLTSGVLLERFADRVAEQFSRVIVSLDATTAALYERIRGVDALDDRRPRRRAAAAARAGHPGDRARDAAPRQLPRAAAADRAREGAGARSDLVPAGRHVVARLRARGRAEPRSGAAAQAGAGRRRDRRVRGDHRADDRRLRRATSSPGSSPNRRTSCGGCRATTRRCAGAEPFPRVVLQRAVGVGRRRGQRLGAALFLSRIDRQRPARRRLPRSSRGNLRAFRESFDVGANPVCVRCVCSLKTSWRSAPWAS